MRRMPLVLAVIAVLISASVFAAPAKKSAPAKTAKTARTAASPGATKSKTAAKPEDKSRLKSDTFSGLEFRSIGPALTSGRVTDFAVQPGDLNTWYVTAAYGGVWKTINHGVTWSPIFDGEGTSSIGCVAVDPTHPLTVWVGSGENNSQRSVGWGDGIYRSLDGGKSWENLGLKASEHIGKILIDPRNTSVVYVAAQGPLWAAGGDRGLYKTTDAGKTWKRVLEIDEYTGVSDLAFDPRDPDVIFATSYQRHRKEWTLIDGGPGSGIWKSTDAGATWRRLKNGLPEEDMGRIGIAIARGAPSTVYAIVEAANQRGGIYVSTDGGENWDRRNNYMTSSPQYYNELFADPNHPDRVYSVDTFLQVTEDGGRTWKRAGEKSKHVDNHVVWIQDDDSDHLVVGCDGGLYESYDRGATWHFFANLPITQFYKICVDDAKPFYNVYGGTQDNNTQGGPTRTANNHGIRNTDWFITVGGDGFQPRVDPTNPDIVYSEWQHGELVRFDKKTGERIDIQPQEEPGEPPLRWNWDSPIIISPHSPTRLYFAAQRVYRTDDRGDSWKPVSGDLTRQTDRNKLPVMGRVWSVDAVAKNASTSFYGNIVSLSESPKQEGLLYVGTDDGLIQVSENGGSSWRKVDKIAGVPDRSYVTRLEASKHDANVVYGTFNNHKTGDFKPYVMRSSDRGKSWTSITGDLPVGGPVWAIAEDHIDPNLLFVGTEFGVFFTPDRGKKWIQLKGGLPVTAVRDLAIQARENDLVLGTFGRGFYVLDDYTPLRSAKEPVLDSTARILPMRAALMYVPASPMGGEGKAEQGEQYFVAPNPPFGAVITYWLRDALDTRRKRRLKAEKDLVKEGRSVYYPSWDSLRAESREEDPAIVVTITDPDGNVVRRMTAPSGKGFHRVAWDLRYPAPDPTDLDAGERDRYDDETAGPMAAPGSYAVSISQRVEGKLTPLAGPVAFQAVPLGEATIPVSDRPAIAAFQQKTSRLQRAVLGAASVARETGNRVRYLKRALDDTPSAPPALGDRVRELERQLADLNVELNGDDLLRRRNEPSPTSLTERMQNVVNGHWFTTMDPTRTHRHDYEIAAAQFSTLLPKLRAITDQLTDIEKQADAAGAPWTPGRGIPTWSDH